MSIELSEGVKAEVDGYARGYASASSMEREPFASFCRGLATAAILADRKEGESKTCEWTRHKSGQWEIGDNIVWWTPQCDVTIEECSRFTISDYRFCPYCGKRIKVKGGA